MGQVLSLPQGQYAFPFIKGSAVAVLKEWYTPNHVTALAPNISERD